jgi:hypothetical protein
MRKQQQIWHDEHVNQGTLPTMANIQSASGVVLFTEWLKKRGMAMSGKAVDIGAGKGRNSVHLAKLGFDVWALEYIEPAIEASKRLAEKNGVANKIHFELAEVDTNWQVAEITFLTWRLTRSQALISRLKKAARNAAMKCIVRSNQVATPSLRFVRLMMNGKLIANHPGPEPNSTIWPQNGKFQKDYDETELHEFYKNFEIIEIKKISKPAFKLGRHGTATNFWMILQK